MAAIITWEDSQKKRVKNKNLLLQDPKKHRIRVKVKAHREQQETPSFDPAPLTKLTRFTVNSAL